MPEDLCFRLDWLLDIVRYESTEPTGSPAAETADFDA